MRERGRPLIVEWRESDDAASLHQQYRQEPHAEVRTRLHALWLLRQGQSLRQTSSALGVHYVTLQQWVAWYRQGGVEEVRRHRRANPQGRPSLLTNDQKEVLRDQAAQGNFHTAQEAQQWVQQRFGVAYSLKGIYTLLHRLRVHPKVPRPQAVQASPQAQEEWKKGG